MRHGTTQARAKRLEEGQILRAVLGKATAGWKKKMGNHEAL